ncbi:unnamed protein product [marine sediment metagenome]|uniref:Calcineurin-like phosphoesterase domain-containing protein n=1 Tax=marine sediment metagenome TaxID=412755 RepID=X0ZDS0_9ZZZZ
MLIGVLSDTHGDVHGTRQAVRSFESLGVEMLLHCGDIGTAEVVSLLSAWPVHFVFGNVDQQAFLRGVITEAGHVCHDRFGSLTVKSKAVALLHGDDMSRLQHTIQSRQWDLVCHGHTHSPSQQHTSGTLVLNPGAIARTHRSCVATVELPSMAVTHIPLL